eukprot:UN12579
MTNLLTANNFVYVDLDEAGIVQVPVAIDGPIQSDIHVFLLNGYNKAVHESAKQNITAESGDGWDKVGFSLLTEPFTIALTGQSPEKGFDFTYKIRDLFEDGLIYWTVTEGGEPL